MTKAPAVTTVRKELRRIARNHGGRLLAEDVVEEAKPSSSPLHNYFEWDNSKAARAWRLEQARLLIRITVEYREETQDTMRVFVHLKQDRSDQGGYREMNVVLANPGLRSQLLADALEDMRLFQKKYRLLKELSAVFDAMDSVIVRKK